MLLERQLREREKKIESKERFFQTQIKELIDNDIFFSEFESHNTKSKVQEQLIINEKQKPQKKKLNNTPKTSSISVKERNELHNIREKLKNEINKYPSQYSDDDDDDDPFIYTDLGVKN